MSMIPYNMFFHNPFSLLDHFFDDDLQLQLRDHSGKFSMAPGGDFTYKVDTSGFQPNELKVEVMGDEIVIKGEHRMQGPHETVERSFVRRLRIPADINKESITCDLDNGGKLTVAGKKVAVEQPQARSLPINVHPKVPQIKAQKK